MKSLMTMGLPSEKILCYRVKGTIFFAKIRMTDGRICDIITVVQGHKSCTVIFVRCSENYKTAMLLPKENPATGGAGLGLEQEVDLHGEKIWLIASSSTSYGSFGDTPSLTDVPEPPEKTSFWDNPFKWAGEKIDKGVEWCKENAGQIWNFLIGTAVVVGSAVVIMATCGTAAPFIAAGAVALGGTVVISNTVQDIKSGEARSPWEMIAQTFLGCATGAFIGYTGFTAGSLLAGSPLATSVFSLGSGMLNRTVMAISDKESSLDEKMDYIFSLPAMVMDVGFGNALQMLSNYFTFGKVNPFKFEVEAYFSRLQAQGQGKKDVKANDNKNSLENGRFADPSIEEDYSKYVNRKIKEGKPPKGRLEWKEARDYWLNDSPMARGNAFNDTARDEGWYDYYEVHLANGKRVDSYDPINHEIISRKATDLNTIDESTFRGYLKELSKKYSPGTKIRSNVYPELDGIPLEGDFILEIPLTNKSLPDIEEYIKIAKEYDVTLRFRGE